MVSLLAEHDMSVGRAWYVCWQSMVCLLTEHGMSTAEHGMSAGTTWYVCWQSMVCLLAEHGMSADRAWDVC